MRGKELAHQRVAEHAAGTAFVDRFEAATQIGAQFVDGLVAGDCLGELVVEGRELDLLDARAA